MSIVFALSDIIILIIARQVSPLPRNSGPVSRHVQSCVCVYVCLCVRCQFLQPISQGSLRDMRHARYKIITLKTVPKRSRICTTPCPALPSTTLLYSPPALVLPLSPTSISIRADPIRLTSPVSYLIGKLQDLLQHLLLLSLSPALPLPPLCSLFHLLLLLFFSVLIYS